MAHTKIEGIDYTPDGVMKLRAEVIVLRNNLQDNSSDKGIQTTVVLTHVIVLLSYLADLKRGIE